MKLGLILEGGASRGYFSCGILEALEHEGVMADVLVGTSAGIANGVTYVTGQSRRNYVIATQYQSDPRYKGWKYLFDPSVRSYYNLPFVFEDVPNKHLPFDFDAFAAWPGAVYGAVTNLYTGQAEYLPVPRDDRRFTVLKASCALPMMFPPIYVGGKPYFDGGVTASIPVQPALDADCDKIIVVLTQPRDYRKEASRGMNVLARHYARRYPQFALALKNRHLTYNAELGRLAHLEEEGRVFVIAPAAKLGIKRTEGDPTILGNLYDQGYQRFYEVWPALQKYLST